MDKEQQYYLALLLITIAGVAIAALTVLGPNVPLDGTDDFIILQFANTTAHYGFGFAHLPQTTFTTAYLFMGIPALFMDVFGANIVTESMLGILSLVGATATVFLIGKVQKDDLAGILASVTFILIPIVASEGATPGDSMPVAFMAALSVLMLLLGVKRGDWRYYMLSGFIGLAGALAGSTEVLFVFVFIIPALAYLLLKSRDTRQARNTLLFAAGVLLAASLIALLGYALQSDPTVWFRNNFYHYPGSPQPQPGFVLSQVLPTSSSFLGQAATFSLFDYKSLIATNGSYYMFSLFGYLALFGGIYLAVRKKAYALLPIAWLLIMLLYLSFGKSNPFYSEYLLIRPRFMTIAAPPMAVVIGLALSEFFGKKIHGKSAKRAAGIRSLRTVLTVAIIIAYAFSAVTALAEMSLMQKTALLNPYAWVQTAQMLGSLQSGVPIYVVSGLTANPGPSSFIAPVAAQSAYNTNTLASYLIAVNQVNWLGVEVYAGFKAPIIYTTLFSNCSSLPVAYFISVNLYPAIYPNNFPSCGGLTRIYTQNVSKISTELTESAYAQRYGIWKNSTIS